MSDDKEVGESKSVANYAVQAQQAAKAHAFAQLYGASAHKIASLWNKWPYVQSIAQARKQMLSLVSNDLGADETYACVPSWLDDQMDAVCTQFGVPTSDLDDWRVEIARHVMDQVKLMVSSPMKVSNLPGTICPTLATGTCLLAFRLVPEFETLKDVWGVATLEVYWPAKLKTGAEDSWEYSVWAARNGCSRVSLYTALRDRMNELLSQYDTEESEDQVGPMLMRYTVSTSVDPEHGKYGAKGFYAAVSGSPETLKKHLVKNAGRISHNGHGKAVDITLNGFTHKMVPQLWRLGDAPALYVDDQDDEMVWIGNAFVSVGHAAKYASYVSPLGSSEHVAMAMLPSDQEGNSGSSFTIAANKISIGKISGSGPNMQQMPKKHPLNEAASEIVKQVAQHVAEDIVGQIAGVQDVYLDEQKIETPLAPPQLTTAIQFQGKPVNVSYGWLPLNAQLGIVSISSGTPDHDIVAWRITAAVPFSVKGYNDSFWGISLIKAQEDPEIGMYSVVIEVQNMVAPHELSLVFDTGPVTVALT